MKNKQNFYIDNTELAAELQKWQDSAVDPHERTPSERLGEMLILLHDKILQHKNFSGYRQDLKEDMKSYSLFRIIKCGLASYDPSKGSTPFAYFTRAIFLNYYACLAKYYKRLNAHQQYVKDCLMQINTHGDSHLEEILKQFKTSGED